MNLLFLFPQQCPMLMHWPELPYLCRKSCGCCFFPLPCFTMLSYAEWIVVPGSPAFWDQTPAVSNFSARVPGKRMGKRQQQQVTRDMEKELQDGRELQRDTQPPGKLGWRQMKTPTNRKVCILYKVWQEHECAHQVKDNNHTCRKKVIISVPHNQQ